MCAVVCDQSGVPGVTSWETKGRVKTGWHSAGIVVRQLLHGGVLYGMATQGHTRPRSAAPRAPLSFVKVTNILGLAPIPLLLGPISLGSGELPPPPHTHIHTHLRVILQGGAHRGGQQLHQLHQLCGEERSETCGVVVVKGGGAGRQLDRAAMSGRRQRTRYRKRVWCPMRLCRSRELVGRGVGRGAFRPSCHGAEPGTAEPPSQLPPSPTYRQSPAPTPAPSARRRQLPAPPHPLPRSRSGAVRCWHPWRPEPAAAYTPEHGERNGWCRGD